MLAGDRLKMILSLFVFMISITVFSILASEVSRGKLLAFDTPSLLFIHSHASSSLDIFFKTVTHIGDSIVILFLATVLGLYYLYKKAYQKASLVLLSIGSVIVANTALKSIFQRDRPSLWQHIVSETNFSFPSGHAMMSAAFVMLLIIIFWKTRYRLLTVALGILVMLLVGTSRLYLGVHYPSDILAGWCVSAALVTFVLIGTTYLSTKK